MEAILPFKIKNEQIFFESALKVGFDEMEIYKFIYIMQLSDLDIFPKMHDERIQMLIYGWEICEDYKQKVNPNEMELPEEMETILKLLVPWSMDIWFSKEWDKSKYYLKTALIHCLNRARDLLMRMPDMMQINWDFLLLYNLKPWSVMYLKNLNVTKEKTLENGAESIETEELPATEEDISYVKLEQLPIIVLRLVKLFDQSSIDMVKTLCMRVIAAWNKIHQTELATSGSRRPYIPPEDKRCLMLICHIYLMAVYESDDVKGYVIDNMINNIRFYYQGFQNSTPLHIMDNLEYTPARYIALTNIHLRVQKRDFFDFFIWNKYDTALVNLFGVVSQAYKSYLLGNLLMELNNMNEDDFASNIPLYKRLMNSYVNEREKSEIFLISELNKIEAQRYAHNIIQTVKNVTDFKSKICKGNRMSNIGNYENSDDIVAPLADSKSEDNNSEGKLCEIEKKVIVEEMEDEEERVRIKESELRLDPIFQNLPNNESILYYVYDVLAKKDYKGWHFAKIVLLVKIIGCEQNMIETWRYHPGLTTDFMLNLEVKLSDHYVDLAKIFKDHPFLEQEFWLTAFYLNPTSEIYEVIKRLGMRNNRKRTDEHTKLVMSIDNIEAKYGLLSSTIDVKELASMSNTDDPATDYDPLFLALHSLRVPDSLVKDMLTGIFLPRNRSFAWSVDWVVLRNRCKMILTSSKEKKRFVDLNMAEANERLKYLIIDYEKYKNRPQLDYGTIEEGYENLMTSAEFDKESEEEEEEEEDFEDDEDVYENKRRGRGSSTAAARKKEDEKVEEDNSQEDDPFLMGKRRTRARTAATLASFLFQTLPRSTRRKRNQKLQEDETKADEEKVVVVNDDKYSESKSPITTSESPIPSPPTTSCDQKDTQITNVPTKNLTECLKRRPTYLNTTQGFQNLIDIWNVEKSELESVDENCVSLMESSTALQIAVKLKLLNKEINPLGCDEKEYIDDTEMLIHNAEFAIKKQFDLNAVKAEELSYTVDKTTNFVEPAVAMDIDNNEENVKTYSIQDANIETSVENIEASHLQDLEESLNEKVMEIEISETNNIELPHAEKNSRETTESDLSTTAHKNSGEVCEANTEINSKHNSVNPDTEMEEADTESEKTRIAEKENEEMIEEYQEIEEISEETEKDRHKSSNEKDDALEEEENAEEKKLEAEANITDEKSSNDTEFKISDESKETDNENKVDKTEMRQTKKNDVSESEELLTKKTLNEQPVLHEMVENDLQKLSDIEKKSNNSEELSTLQCENLNDLGEKCSDNRHVFVEQSIADKESDKFNETGQSKEFPTHEGTFSREKINSNETTEKCLETLENIVEEGHDEANKTEINENSANIADKLNEEVKISQKTLGNDTESKSVSVDSEATDNTESKHIAGDSVEVDNSELEPIAIDSVDADNSESISVAIGSIETYNSEYKSIAVDSVEADNSKLISVALDSVDTDNSETKPFALDSVKTDNSELRSGEVDSIELNQIALGTAEGYNSELRPVVVDSIETENSELKSIALDSVEADNFESRSVAIALIEKDNCEQKPIAAASIVADNSESRSVAVDSIETRNSESKPIATDSVKTDNSESKSVAVDLVETNKAIAVDSIEQNTTESNDFIVDSIETNEPSQEPAAHISETQRKQVELESIEAITSKDNQSLPPSQNNESSIVLHYSLSDELNETDATTIQNKVEITEFIKVADETTDQGEVECKKTTEALSDQTNPETLEDENYAHSPIAFSNETTVDSVKTTDDQESVDGEIQKLKQLCLTKNANVILRKLCPQDLVNLRQPTIKIQRINYEKYAVEFRAKRRCFEGKVYLEFDESSNSNTSYGTNTSSSEAYRPTKLKRKIPIRRHSTRQPRTSESENDSNNSDDFKLSTIMAKSRKRRLSTPTSQSSTSQHVTGPKSARKLGPKSVSHTTGPKSSKQNLIVTPRSASGLKLRISNAEQNRQGTGVKNKRSRHVVYDEIIQLSSSSSDTCVLNNLTAIEEEIIGDEDHPLFEEEIII